MHLQQHPQPLGTAPWHQHGASQGQGQGVEAAAASRPLTLGPSHTSFKPLGPEPPDPNPPPGAVVLENKANSSAALMAPSTARAHHSTASHSAGPRYLSYNAQENTPPQHRPPISSVNTVPRSLLRARAALYLYLVTVARACLAAASLRRFRRSARSAATAATLADTSRDRDPAGFFLLPTTGLAEPLLAVAGLDPGTRRSKDCALLSAPDPEPDSVPPMALAPARASLTAFVTSAGPGTLAAGELAGSAGGAKAGPWEVGLDPCDECTAAGCARLPSWASAPLARLAACSWSSTPRWVRCSGRGRVRRPPRALLR